jgi:prolyl-tRNA synthetase
MSKLSEILFKTFAVKNTASSHDLLVKASFISNSSLGIFNFLPLGLKVKSKIIDIISRNLREIGCEQVELSIVQPVDNMVKTNRMNGEVFSLTDRKNQSLLLAPTHEEEITALVGDMKLTYKNLPVKLYRI